MTNKDYIKKAALYIRVSTLEQVDKFSIPAQKEALLNYCKLNNLEIHQYYIDAGVSGSSIEKRTAMQELLHDAANTCFGHVICLRFDRLARDAADLLYIYKTLSTHNVELRSLSEEIDLSTPTGILKLSTLAAAAQYQREQIVQNVKMGMAERSRQGVWNCGNQVLGYQWCKHPSNSKLSKVEIIPKEASLVQLIFTLFAAETGLRSIANHLNALGYRSKRNRTFSQNTVKSILMNCNYIGKIRYSDCNASQKDTKQTVDGQHEPIISLELWNRVQQRMNEMSKPNTRLHQTHSSLSGLVKCPRCGSSMIPNHVNRKRFNSQDYISHYYVCSNYHSKGSSVCLPHHIKADLLEQVVFEKVQQLLVNNDFLNYIVDRTNTKLKDLLDPILKKANKQLEKLKSIQNREKLTFELFEEGKLDPIMLEERLMALQHEKQLIEQQISLHNDQISNYHSKFLSSSQVSNALLNFQSILNNTVESQRSKLLRLLISKISVPQNRDLSQVNIHLNRSLNNLVI